MFKGRQKAKEKLGEQEADGFTLSDLFRPHCKKGQGEKLGQQRYGGGKGAASCARTKVGTAARHRGYSKLGREG